MKVGVVIFHGKCCFSDESLAALKWASSVFGKLSEPGVRHVLFVKEGEKTTACTGKKPKSEGVPGTGNLSRDGLLELVKELCKITETFTEKDRNETIQKFEKFIGKSNGKAVGKSYEGHDIKEILEGAIDELNLDALVLGGSTLTRGIVLDLNTKCSVVLTEHKKSEAGTSRRAKK